MHATRIAHTPKSMTRQTILHDFCSEIWLLERFIFFCIIMHLSHNNGGFILEHVFSSYIRLWTLVVSTVHWRPMLIVTWGGCHKGYSSVTIRFETVLFQSPFFFFFLMMQHIRAVQIIECDDHAHLVSKAGSVISSKSPSPAFRWSGI